MREHRVAGHRHALGRERAQQGLAQRPRRVRGGQRTGRADHDLVGAVEPERARSGQHGRLRRGHAARLRKARSARHDDRLRSIHGRAAGRLAEVDGEHRGMLSCGAEVLTGLDEAISPGLRFGSTMVNVLAALTSSLPTLLAMVAAGLFALMAWAGSSTH